MTGRFFKCVVAATASIALTGCANMTSEEMAELSAQMQSMSQQFNQNSQQYLRQSSGYRAPDVNSYGSSGSTVRCINAGIYTNCRN